MALTLTSIVEVRLTVWNGPKMIRTLLLICFRAPTGTQVQGWEYVAKDNNQFWDLTRVSRTYSEVLAIVKKDSLTPKDLTFSSYRTDGLSVSFP